MLIRLVIVAATAFVATAAPAGADPGDHWREQWKIQAECDKKLYEAKSQHEFYKERRECNKKFAEWRGKQREEATKFWREVEKKRDEYYRWDD